MSANLVCGKPAKFFFFCNVLDGKQAAEHYDCKYTEVSASMNMQVDDLLVGIVKQIRLHKEAAKKPTTSSTKKHKLHKQKSLDHDKQQHHHKSPFTFFGKFLKRHISGEASQSCDNLMVL